MLGLWPTQAIRIVTASAHDPEPAPALIGVPGGRYNVAAAHSPRMLRMLAGGQAPRAAAGAPAQVAGIDVSSAQHPGGAAIAWSQVAAAGYKFAFVKATEGSYYANPYYASDVAGARAAGLFTAGYEFAVPNDSSGTLQADLALDATGAAPTGTTLPLILDIEYDPYVSLDHTNMCYGLSPASMVAWIGAFAAEVQRRTGELPVIYTTSDWWNTCTGGSTAFSASPLWIASGGSSPSLPAAWSAWTYWQYTSTGTVPGISGNVDISRFNSGQLTAAVPATQSDAAGHGVSVAIRSLNASAGEPLTYAATGLPPGTTIDQATGQISGTLPTSPARYPVSVTIGDSLGNTQAVRFTWQVHGAVSLTWPGQQSTVAGSAISFQVKATDGLPGCSLKFTASGLPPGLTISPCGQIAGWPSRAGSYRVTVQVTDSSSKVLTATSFNWSVAPPPLITAGPIRLAMDDKCLAGLPDSSGTTVVALIWSCGQSAGQRWGIAQNGTVRLGTRCLAAITTSTGGIVPALRSCTSRLAQLWRQADAGGLVNVQTGLCLTDPGASQTNGTPVTLAGCVGTASQGWTLPAGQLAPGLQGRCIAGYSATSTSPAKISLTKCATTSSQNWTITPHGAITVAGLCLATAQTGTAATTGTPVTLSACGTSPGQHWQPIPTPGGLLIVNPASGRCLAVPTQAVTTTSPLALNYCVTNYPRRAWRSS